MFEKILIANRGEIACRVIKTAKQLGIATVAVYSDADRRALHVSMADEAIHIGPSASQDSYLRGERIIEAAIKTGAQAIHPGYGFLSENAQFAEMCTKNKLTFIGPPVEAIKAMGSKSAAKTIMQKAGVPLVPGYHGADQNPELLRQSAEKMGYPVLLKAVAGGGGKGMRQVWSADEFDTALSEAKRESKASFDNDDMLVEKFLTQPRHVEVQVFFDQHGNGVYLFERDCSLQRRHQKIIEEAPAPNLPSGFREQLGKAAVQAARAINYQGAGTVEFLLDAQKDGDSAFYFMEMNTRLQVEHPVTEMITGQDLVEWQLRVANAEELPLKQEQLQIHGHSFEARIYAEDPDNDFLPATGKLTTLIPPLENAQIRVDTGVIQGDEVSPFYDPMIAKLVVWDENRERALARLAKALSEYQVDGVTTNIRFLYNLATCPAFINADLDTGFITKHQQAIFHQAESDVQSLLPLASLYLLLRNEQVIISQRSSLVPPSPWENAGSWRLNQANMHSGAILVNGQAYDVPVEEFSVSGERQFRISFATSSTSEENQQTVLAQGALDGNSLTAQINGHRQLVTVIPNAQHFTLFTAQAAMDFSLVQPDYGETDESTALNNFSAPMNGTIVDVLVSKGDHVKSGAPLVIMEAMKMQHTITAPNDGVVTEVFFKAGDLVDGDSELLQFTAKEN